MHGDEFFTLLSRTAPFTKLHPRVAAFFKGYLANEKVIRFGEQFVVNTNFPPYPSAAFDQLVAHFALLGEASTRRLYSVTLAVTNRCPFACWHCYNAGRSQADLPLAVLQRLAGELQPLGAAVVTLTGGEPLLRDDLDAIARAFDSRSCLTVGTTGATLTRETAQRLRASGVFAVGISLDSDREGEHDARRGQPGAFRSALHALGVARDAGLYPYAVTVVTRDLLPRARFMPLLRCAADAGALEVHVLEPSATGRLAGQPSVLLKAAERRQLRDYQAEVAHDESLPVLSSLAYLESGDAFGCGAGLTHLYIDGAGEVCPCNLLPLSFGNVAREPLATCLKRMGRHFCQPRAACVARQLAPHLPGGTLPGPAESDAICAARLPATHPLPAFFRVRDAARDEVGAAEVRAAYEAIHGDYDAFWLQEAGPPIAALIARLALRGDERVFEAGCGTGYATVRLAARAGEVEAVDLSPAMLGLARRRVAEAGGAPVRFAVGDALEQLAAAGECDLVFTSWVLGYIPLAPFFAATQRALAPGGRVALLVHREHSPRVPLEIFGELIAENPAAQQKRVAFDFPRDGAQLRSIVEDAGLAVELLSEERITFHCPTAGAVMAHLLKSGAGTAYYEAIDPARRAELTERFLARLAARLPPGAVDFAVDHDYITCIARKRAPQSRLPAGSPPAPVSP